MSLVQTVGPTESGLVVLANAFRDWLTGGGFLAQKLAAMGLGVPRVISTGWKQREQWLNQAAGSGANRVGFLPGTMAGDLGELLAPRPVGKGRFPTLATVGKVLAVVVTAAGTGYTAPSLVFSAPPPGGTTATATVQIDGSGHVTGVTVTNPGAGYSSDTLPTATLTDPNGSGAEFLIQVSATARPLWTWHRWVTASVWSVGQTTALGTAPSPADLANEELQIRASDALVDLVLAGLHKCGQGQPIDPGTGNIQRPRLRRDPRVSANMGYGLEVLLEFVHVEPIGFDLPNDVITDVHPAIVQAFI